MGGRIFEHRDVGGNMAKAQVAIDSHRLMWLRFSLMGAGLLASFYLSQKSWAGDVLPAPSANMGDIVMNGSLARSYDATKTLQVRFYASCFGTNLRSVANPLSPDANVKMTIGLKTNDDKDASVEVQFKGDLVVPTADNSEQNLSITATGLSSSGLRATRAGNVVSMVIPDGIRVTESLSANGEVTVKSQAHPVRSISFYQEGVSGGTYMANTGPLSSSTTWALSSDHSSLEIRSAFPGQTGFCGGYFSPIMVFFGDERPQFTSVSRFPLSPTKGSIYWPEAGNWAILAMDRNGDGQISEKDELFGEDETRKIANGFDALAKLDSNKDRKMNAKDKNFGRLLLWRDANANGVSDPGELKSLAEEGLSEISLIYEKNIVTPVAARAELRERSTALVKGKSVQVIDVWFGPQGETVEAIQMKSSAQPARKQAKGNRQVEQPRTAVKTEAVRAPASN